jgi:site-specific recombinase XerD
MEAVEGFIRASKAESTLRAYEHDWKAFCTWCETHGLCPLPATPETVAVYLAETARRLKVASLQRRLNGITEGHRLAGLEPPTHSPLVANVMKGVRRTIGTAPAQKAPTVTDDIRAMVAARDGGLLGARDRALILVGFASAFRRSELVGLEVRDLGFDRNGLTILLRKSKTDQDGEGRKLGLPFGSCPDTCPVRTLQDWLTLSGIAEGPVFRGINRHGQLQPDALTAQSVALVVKKLAQRAGLDPARYAGHSLRSGHVTAAFIGGAAEHIVQRQTGHKSTAMLRRYFRDADLFRQNSAGKLGL